MEIKILGTGCSNCKKLMKLTEEAVSELGIEATVDKVEDLFKIMEYGVMRTPGLVIDGKVALSGKMPKYDELKELISKNQ